jgi:hypothetical protein
MTRKREGWLDLVFALDHQKVEEIQRRGLDRDHRFAGAGHGIRDLGQHEFVGAAILRTEHGFHEEHPGFRPATPESFMPDLQTVYNRGAWLERLGSTSCALRFARK